MKVPSRGCTVLLDLSTAKDKPTEQDITFFIDTILRNKIFSCNVPE
jgi:predicted nucleic acid binding AN1-type Zn finger protein